MGDKQDAKDMLGTSCQWADEYEWRNERWKKRIDTLFLYKNLFHLVLSPSLEIHQIDAKTRDIFGREMVKDYSLFIMFMNAASVTNCVQLIISVPTNYQNFLAIH